MTRRNRTLSALVLSGVAVVAGTVATLPTYRGRVVHREWYRQVGGRPAALHSGTTRLYWPHVSRAQLEAWIEQDGGEPRYWAPRNSEEHYCVRTDTGEHLGLELAEWIPLTHGSEVWK